MSNFNPTTLVVGCTHTCNITEAGRYQRGACAPCIAAYAEEVRRETVERCAKIAKTEVDPHGDDCSDLHCQGYQKAARTIASNLRAALLKI